ncbi:helix-turn-helix domain-containing protein [Actinophytocola oryzae]|uniref:helix-turn-helix domain-containing protein n=1 Tax=Actinophytocola oryzae TaxID=502181 RepID=UPI0010644AFA
MELLISSSIGFAVACPLEVVVSELRGVLLRLCWEVSVSGSRVHDGDQGIGCSPGVGGTEATSVGAVPLLLTPAQAARLLQVRESWLRRRAAERRVPCSFVGKHLRFSHADVEAIVVSGARPARPMGRGQSRPAAGPGSVDGSPNRRG